MLWTIFVILLVLWFLGLVSSYTFGGFVHLPPATGAGSDRSGDQPGERPSRRSVIGVRLMGFQRLLVVVASSE